MVSEVWIAIILGLVEGITEYLPISSTGHLILFGEALQFTGEKAKSFDVVIQLGAIASVFVLYRERFSDIVFSLREDLRDPRKACEPGIFGLAGICKLALVTGPALLLAFIARHHIKQYLFAPLPVALALGVGGLLILFMERRIERKQSGHGIEELTWQQSLGIGIVQCLALWPGMSRSASAIIGGLCVGLSRTAATEFSFLAAVPILTAAAVYDLVEVVRVFSFEELQLVAIGFVVSFFSALVAMKWFVALVGSWSLRPFAYYRLFVAAFVLMMLWMKSTNGL